MNLRRLSRQIYSLIPLTTREPLQKCKPAIVLQDLWSVNTNSRTQSKELTFCINPGRHANRCRMVVILGGLRENAASTLVAENSYTKVQVWHQKKLFKHVNQ